MELAQVLRRAGYTADGVLARIGELGQEGLARNVTVPAAAALGSATDELATLIRLFILQQPVSADDAAFLPETPYLERADGTARALVDIRPYGSPDDGASGWAVSDLTPGMDHVTLPTRTDYVLGISSASTTLAQMTMRTPVGSALDLGTGCGVQSLHLAKHADRVVATDVNERALKLAGVTAALNDVDVDFRRGSLFEPVAGERFDLIISNPPYVMSPPSETPLMYRETTFEGDALLRSILRDAPQHLTPGGSLQLLVNWAVVEGTAWEDRVRSWVDGSGMDLWVIERERLDKYTYIELWLTDAGLAGSDEWAPAYHRWLDYFARLGIEEVGLGWILLTDAGRDTPHLRFETWPYQVQQPLGEVFARHRSAVDAATLPLEDLLAARPRLDDVTQETFGQPGATDP
ncbi:MAG: methyltransferase, partial [Propionibacterium sp.]|nr:methyltransferase [Propionibacterium sp.]